jgi:lipopolysaccharide/colanic/teichoic acid biosynthesis glycosyltransferase
MQTRCYRYSKKLLDVAGAALALVALAVPMLVIAWAIRRDGTGPALFAHTRVGRGGRPFRCLKFRTMRCDAQEILERWRRTNDPLWHAFVAGNHKLENDPRVTAIGRWLRKTSLDELPQLFNVLRGQMSLVGPRPVTAAELPQYGEEGSRAYLALTPGITGLWQVSGRSDTTFAERVALDLRYGRECSFALDARILVRTVGVVLGRRGAF